MKGDRLLCIQFNGEQQARFVLQTHVEFSIRCTDGT